MDSGFWGGVGPSAGGSLGFPAAPATSYQQPANSQRSQRSLPGPAGRRAAAAGAQPATSGALPGSAQLAESLPRVFHDPEFLSPAWQQAVEEGGVPFDENLEPFRGNTVRAALALQHNAVVDRLLAVVVSVKRCYSGEAFVRLKDPTGSIGGTLTRAVLDSEPDVRQGAVVRLRRVAVLRTPPPRRISHLCITLDSVIQVIPPPLESGRLGAAGAASQPPARRALPALPAPPPAAAAAPAPASSWAPPLPPPQRQQPQPWHQEGQHQQHQHQHRRQQPPLQQQQQQQQHGFQPLQVQGHPTERASGGGQAMPPPPMRQGPPTHLLTAPSSSFAWPSLAPAQQHARHGQPYQQQQQQRRQPPQREASSFAWPTLQQGSTARRHAGAQPGQAPAPQQQPAASASVNFSMPAISEPSSPWNRAQCQDDASSRLERGRQAAAGTDASPTAATQHPNAGAGWLQGLLAEAEYPFGALGATQPSQAPARAPPRPPLAERQQQQRQERQQEAGSPPLGQAVKRARQQPSPLALPGGATVQAVFGGVDDLELGDE